MKKKLFALIVVAAMLISMFSMSSVFAAAEPSWIWKPAEDGHATGFGACTSQDADDASYTTFTTISKSLEGFAYPGADVLAPEAGGNLAKSDMGAIDTAQGKFALIKYRTTAEDKVYGELVWHNLTEHGYTTFEYVNDGEWHFAVVDLTKDAWTSVPEISWFRYDFANGLSDADEETYSVDLAYIAMFASEADANAYAAADGEGTVPDPDDGKDDNKDDNKNDNKDDNKGDTQPPKTGDVNIIVAVAAAGLVLTVILKKKVTV